MQTCALAFDAVQAGFPEPADRSLRRFFGEHPAFGRRDRLHIADTVFDLFRHRRLFHALAQAMRPGADGARALLAARESVIDAGPARDATDAGAADAARVADLIARVERVTGVLPPPVRYSLPDWLWDAFVASHAHEAQALALAMLEPAPIDLRVNPLRTRPGALVATLEAKGIPVEPIAGLANGLRVRGRPALESLDAWAHGGFEMQDAASQRLVALCAPRQGQVVVDFCAGAGGKALAMASRMRNIGQVYAFDPVEARLAALRERAARAGATIVLPVRIADENDARLARYAGRADLVLVDAPCSGTGTLRRHPDLKWRLAPADVAGYVALQRRILRAAAKLVRTGGMLVYATCSVLAEENVAQLDSFGIENDPKYRERPLIELDRDIIDGQWLPGRDDSDGFFVGRWLREADGHYNRMVTHRVTKGVTP